LKRLLKYIQDLKKLDTYFKRPFGDLTEADMERFILDLENGVVGTMDGHAYAGETQVVIKKMIKKFYKWLEGDNMDVPRKVRWIDTSCESIEYVSLSKDELDKILSLMTSNSSYNLVRNRALLIFLFDSGLRAEEVLNVRMRHLTVKNDNYVVRVEFSKTKKRTITLPFCKDLLNAWLDMHPLPSEPSAQLFPITYNALRGVVNRAGDIIKKHITPHSLRHSAATYWCQHLTPYELCYRLGWSMSSKMPQRYIDREGLNQEKAAKAAAAAASKE
jgi:integrase